jgi:hypothetical protein
VCCPVKVVVLMARNCGGCNAHHLSEDAIQIPVDELAMLVLCDLASWHEANEYNYGNSLRQDTACGYAGQPDAQGRQRSHGCMA